MDYATLLEGKQTAPTTLWKRVGRSRVTWAVIALALLAGGQGGLAFLAFGWGMILFPFLGKDDGAQSKGDLLIGDSTSIENECERNGYHDRDDDFSGYGFGPYGYGYYRSGVKTLLDD